MSIHGSDLIVGVLGVEINKLIDNYFMYFNISKIHYNPQLQAKNKVLKSTYNITRLQIFHFDITLYVFLTDDIWLTLSVAVTLAR